MIVRVIRTPTRRAELAAIAETQFGDMLKAVDGSRQDDLWGINLYPGERGEEWIEFDSVINIRPSQGNRSRGVEDRSGIVAWGRGCHAVRRDREPGIPLTRPGR
jgi:hypothetical protein